MVQLNKEPTKVFRQAWDSVTRKASNRTACTVDDIHEDSGHHHDDYKKTSLQNTNPDFRRAADSSWLAGPLASATQVYKNAPQCCCARRARDESNSAVDDANQKRTGDTSWLRGAGQLWKVDKFDRKNYR